MTRNLNSSLWSKLSGVDFPFLCRFGNRKCGVPLQRQIHGPCFCRSCFWTRCPVWTPGQTAGSCNSPPAGEYWWTSSPHTHSTTVACLSLFCAKVTGSDNNKLTKRSQPPTITIRKINMLVIKIWSSNGSIGDDEKHYIQYYQKWLQLKTTNKILMMFFLKNQVLPQNGDVCHNGFYTNGFCW